MNIEEAKKKLLEPQKIPLVEIIRKFKREGIENFVITRTEIVETLLTAYEKEKEKNKKINKYIEDRAKIGKDIQTFINKDYVEQEYISKDKIKELEKLNEEATGIGYGFAIYYLQSLLKEE